MARLAVTVVSAILVGWVVGLALTPTIGVIVGLVVVATVLPVALRRSDRPTEAATTDDHDN